MTMSSIQQEDYDGEPFSPLQLNVTNASTDIWMYPPRPPIPRLVQAIDLFNYYSVPIIVVLGSIGNILSYLVFTKTRVKKVSSVRYLAAIAITDTGFLWTFFFTPLQMYYNQPIITYVGVCQVVTFLNYAFTFLCIWYMVALVVDRFISLYMPLRKSSMCTVFRAKIVIVGLAAMAVVCYSYVTYFYGTDGDYGQYCVPFLVFQGHYQNLDRIDTVFVAVIPYVIITILIVLILIRSCEYYRISASAEICPRSESRRRAGRQTSHPPTRITRVLCPVIIITLLFNIPQNVIRTLIRFDEGVSKMEIHKWLMLCRIPYLLNFAVKGFLYFVCSGCFRRRLRDYVCEFRLKIKHSCANRTTRTPDPQIIQLEESNPVKKGEAKLLQTAI
ncbi:hypothetical protein SNE40_020476 [Patella caerulea]|uniref:G-protein coupled receptors family 1 profile domain-containing protein n=1 Tax=Patella caerulea TaxID=87958 RepID=A0AAN8J0C0_PATCE